MRQRREMSAASPHFYFFFCINLEKQKAFSHGKDSCENSCVCVSVRQCVCACVCWPFVHTLTPQLSYNLIAALTHSQSTDIARSQPATFLRCCKRAATLWFYFTSLLNVKVVGRRVAINLTVFCFLLALGAPAGAVKHPAETPRVRFLRARPYAASPAFVFRSCFYILWPMKRRQPAAVV